MDRAHEFRTAAARANQDRDRVGWRYPESIRQLAVEHCQEQREAQVPFSRIAEELGINVATLGRWLGKIEPATRPEPRFREVVVAQTQSTEPGRLAVVLPSGLRIEGLELTQAVEIARSLR